MSHDVFISYSHKDRLTANMLCHKLEEEKIRCWIAPRDINPGGSWAGEIADAIPKSKILILILSSYSNASKQVLREVELAINNDIVLIPLRIEDMMPTGSMSYFLSTTHWIDVIDDSFDNKYEVLSNRIKSILNIKVNAIEESIVQDVKKVKKKKKKKSLLKPLLLIASLVLLITLTLYLIFGGYDTIKTFLSENTSSYNPSNTQVYQPSYKPYIPKTPSPTPTQQEIHSPEDFGLLPNKTVDIPDENFKEAILKTLEETGNPVTGELTISDMFKLRCLILAPDEWFEQRWDLVERYPGIISSDVSVKSLEGLQYALNLETLVLVRRNLDDISVLSGLSSLIDLTLSENNISNIFPLKDLSNLTTIDLSWNSVTSLTYLSQLTSLEDLNLSCNHIEDVRVLSLLSNLKRLYLSSIGFNDFSEVNGLAELDFIEELDISGNELNDINELSAFSNMTKLNLSYTGIRDLTPLNQLTNLRCLLFNGISFNSISDIQGLDGLTFLNELELSDNSITDISGLAVFTHLDQLRLDNNSIKDISVLETLLRLKFLSIDSFTYVNNLSTIKKINAIAYIDVIESENNIIYTPDEVSLDPYQVVEISDAGLRESLYLLFEKIGTPITGNITIKDMFEISEIVFVSSSFFEASNGIINEFPNLVATESDIMSLEGLQYAYNLRTLVIMDKEISDISAIKDLVNLRKINFSQSYIGDYNPLGALSNLKELSLPENPQLNDINILANLQNLGHLDLGWNRTIRDVSPLHSLINLRSFSFDGIIFDSMESINGLLELTGLTNLSIAHNEMTDISGISKMKNLEYLNIKYNNISDISVLESLSDLRYLVLDAKTYSSNQQTIQKLSPYCQFEVIESD